MTPIEFLTKPGENPNPLWFRIVIFLAKALVVLLLSGAVVFLKWSGLGFTLGALAGFFFFFVYFRLKHGYWP
jgi:fatty acid desaturase